MKFAALMLVALFLVSGCQPRSEAEERGWLSMDVDPEPPTEYWTDVTVPSVGVTMNCPVTWAWREPDTVLAWMIMDHRHDLPQTRFRIAYNYADMRIFDTVATRHNEVDTFAEIFVYPATGPSLKAIRKAVLDRYEKEKDFTIDDEPAIAPCGPLIHCTYRMGRRTLFGDVKRFAVERYTGASKTAVFDIGFYAPLDEFRKYQDTFDQMISSFRCFKPDESAPARLPMGPKLPSDMPRVMAIKGELTSADNLRVQ